MSEKKVNQSDVALAEVERKLTQLSAFEPQPAPQSPKKEHHLHLIITASLIFILFASLGYLIASKGYSAHLFSNVGITGAVIASSNSCGNVSASITLTVPVSSDRTCFHITANNVQIDCNNNTVTYGRLDNGQNNSYGINNSQGYDGISIINCNITQSNTSTGTKPAIYFVNVNGFSINNSNITTISGDAPALFLQNSSNGVIANNRISVTGATSIGMYFIAGSSDNLIFSNTVNATGGMGILADAIVVRNSSRNNFTNNIINVSGADGIELNTSALLNVFHNNNISNRNSVQNYAILHGIPGMNNTLLYSTDVAQINWTSTDLDTNLTLYSGIDIFLNNNSIGINDIAGRSLKLNGTAKISFIGINYNQQPAIFKDQARCDQNSTFCNVTSWSGGVLDVIVGGFSNYTTNTSARCGKVNTTITLDYDLKANGTCFTINASGITINCSGLKINYSVYRNTQPTVGPVGYGINISGYDNVTVKNCRIFEGNGTNTAPNYGIFFHGNGDDNIITNTNITTYSEFSHGIFINRTSLNNIINFTRINVTGNGSAAVSINNSNGTNITHSQFFTFGNESFGIYLENSERTYVYNNSITTYDGAAHGLYLVANDFLGRNNIHLNNVTTEGLHSFGLFINASNSNNITNTTFTTLANNSAGIYLKGGNFNTFVENFINTTSSYNASGIFLESGENQTFINCNVTTNNSYSFWDISNANKTIIINNSFGSINWTGLNLSTNISLRIGRNITIVNNTIGLANDVNSMKLNSTGARISFFLLGIAQSPNILKDWQRCDLNESLCNVISFDSTAGTLIANVSSFSNYTTNLLPTAPVLLAPTNNYSYVATAIRMPQFIWNNSADNNTADTITYELNIDDNSDFSSLIQNVTSIAQNSSGNTSYTAVNELDVDKDIFWRVRAYDGLEYGNYSYTFNFTIRSYIAISIQRSSVAFGKMAPKANNATTDDLPEAFRLENTGNVLGNVTITGTIYFLNDGFPTSNYQFKVRSNETLAFNSGASSTNWLNTTNVSTRKDVVDLNWSSASNDFLVDINVTVPSNESDGLRNSTVTFELL